MINITKILEFKENKLHILMTTKRILNKTIRKINIFFKNKQASANTAQEIKIIS